MKVLIYSDPHYCEFSSIIRKRGSKYSLRIENIIRSINWLIDLARENTCHDIICAGDFFDSSSLNAAEISALKEIHWLDGQSHVFIPGNHEQGSVGHEYTSSDVFTLLETAVVHRSPSMFTIGNTEICLLPYIQEIDRQPIKEYFPDRSNKKRVIISHNDIQGIQMGSFISKSGFSIEEIEENCDLFINGHIHNGKKISNKIINIGNLTGQNFSEDAFNYDHVVFLLDTDTLKIEVYENPYAFNFYKLDCTGRDFSIFSKLKNNSVITVKCLEEDSDTIKSLISSSPNIIESRVLIQVNKDTTTSEIEELKVDHLSQFKDYVLSNIGDSDIIRSELIEVLK